MFLPLRSAYFRLRTATVSYVTWFCRCAARVLGCALPAWHGWGGSDRVDEYGVAKMLFLYGGIIVVREE